MIIGNPQISKEDRVISHRPFSHRRRAARNRGFSPLLVLALLHPGGAGGSGEGVPDPHRIGRYVLVEPVATPTQREPLMEVVSMTFDGNTVGEAIREALRETGYSLDESLGLPGFDVLPLPRVHRTFEQVQVIEIIHALAGQAYHIVIDPVLRKMTFHLVEPGLIGQETG